MWGEQGVGVSRREHAHTVLARMHAQPQENMCRLTHSTFHGWQRNPALQGHGREDLRGQGAGAILSKLTFPNTPCGVLVCCLSLTSGPLSPRGPILAVVFFNLIKQASPLLSLSLTHCLSLSHTLSPSPFLSLSLTHTHSLSLSLSSSSSAPTLTQGPFNVEDGVGKPVKHAAGTHCSQMRRFRYLLYMLNKMKIVTTID